MKLSLLKLFQNELPMMKRRIILGMGANSFGMAITIAIQLVSLPFFLHFWNLETYGEWLILSAIPSYLSMADVGMVTAAGNKMTMAMGKNDPFEANQIFQSAQAFMLIICGALALIVIPIVLFAPLPLFESMDQRIALAAMSLGVLVALFGGLSEAAFKASEHYASGTMLGNYVRLGEWLGYLLGLILMGSFASVAIGGLIMRLLGCIVGMILVNKTTHALSWGLRFAKLAEIKSTIKPAISFMAFPLGNALSFQGITILVGAMFGPVSVALFTAYRTIARVAVQCTSIFSHVLWPEFSRLFGQSYKEAIKKLYLRSSLLGALQAVFLSAVLYFTAPWLLKIWTNDEIHFESSLMLFMLAYASISGAWHIPRVLLMATNQHVNLSVWILLAGGLSVALSWGLSQFHGLIGVVVGMGLGELTIAVICIYLANQFVFGDKILRQRVV
jgi:O-antigen/teichoic acid export membrane protein